MKLTKAERKNEVRKKADEYARSGTFQNWQMIERELIHNDGLTEARWILDDILTREHLNRLCEIANSEEKKVS